MTLHHKIKMMRELHQWSQEDMAERMHMSTNGYARIERGETKLHLDKLEQVAQIFDIDVVELMTAGGRGLICLINENGHNNNANYYGNTESLSLENDKLKLIIDHKDELLAQKNDEIAALKDLVAALKGKQE